jgi:carboxyl-terminal processing protease
VFDVRNNPGGALDSIVVVLSYFLNKGDLVLSTEYSGGYENRIHVGDDGFNLPKDEIGMYKDLKCIVITNENTASAAELFTATLRDYGIAEVVGVNSYGKGCMQTLFPLDSYGIEGGLKLTVAMYYSKSKTVYHGTGIVPDHTVDLSDEAKNINFFLLPEEKDDQLLTAIEKLVK